MALYRCGSGGDTSTPITPSNSAPASMTSGTAYKPTANGYAIASYNNVTPSNSSPVALTSGDIDKIGGNGYAIASYSNITPSNSSPATISSGSIYKASANGKAVASITDVTPSSTAVSVAADDIVKIGGSGVIVDSVPTPTSITPSNSSPVALTADTPVNPTASGYAIASYSSVTPDNGLPVQLSSGSIYKMGGAGKAVASVTNKTPSDTNPPSIASGAIIKASSAGYLVKNTPVNIGVPDIISQANMNGNASRSIAVTKTPRYVIFLMTRNSDSTGRNYSWFYDVAKSAYSLIQYTADGYTHSENTGAPTAISATSSSVTVTNTSAATCRTHALIYY